MTPEIDLVKGYVRVHIQKSVGVRTNCIVPRSEALALPFKSKRCNAEAHARRYVVCSHARTFIIIKDTLRAIRIHIPT